MIRVLKQFLYGSFFLAITSGLAAGVYYGFLKPAPSCTDGKLNQWEVEIDCGGPNCVDCALRHLKPLKARSSQFFVVDGSTTVFLEIENSNANYGAAAFNYDLKLFDNNNQPLPTITGSSFIYPSEIKALVLTGQAIAGDVARGEFAPKDIVWKKSAEFSRPLATTREVVTKSENGHIVVEGVVQNPNAYPLSRAVISATIANKQGFLVNTSKTFVADLLPREERFFKITLPVSRDEIASLDFSRTKIYLEVVR